jgi:hypothetical protein
MTGREFLDVVLEVSDQLWHDDPPQVWQYALHLIAQDVPAHEVLHKLVEHSPLAGSAMDAVPLA